MADIRVLWDVTIWGLTQTSASIAAHGALGPEYWDALGNLSVRPDLQEFSVRRGRNGPLNAVSAGSATIRLLDTERKYMMGTQWFEDTSKPAGFTDVMIGAKLTISCTPQGSGYGGQYVFTGYIDSVDAVSDGVNTNLVEIRAVDAIAALSSVSLKEGVMQDTDLNTPPTFPVQHSGTRARAIINCTNIASGKAVFPDALWVGDLGDSDVQAMEVTGNVWRELQKLAETEWAQGLFINGNGELEFIGRTSSRTATGAVFVDGNSGAGIPYLQVRQKTNRTYVYNQIVLEREDPDGILGGVPEKAESTDSQAVYGIREFSRRGLLNLTNSAGTLQTQALANYWKDQWYRHSVQMTELKVALNAITSYADQRLTAWLEVGDIVEVKWNPQGPATVDEMCVVDQISFTIRPMGPDIMTFKLSPSWAFPASAGKLGSAQLGTATLGI